jgi:ATP-dependent DNA ligase
VVAKPVDVFYQPDKRVMLKVKHERDCDCVVGFHHFQERWNEVGSLLLGLLTMQSPAACWRVCQLSKNSGAS